MRNRLNVLGRLVVLVVAVEASTEEVEASAGVLPLLPPMWNRSGKGMGKCILEDSTAAAMLVFGLALAYACAWTGK